MTPTATCYCGAEMEYIGNYTFICAEYDKHEQVASMEAALRQPNQKKG